ncbi:hypothetical protein ACTOS9_12905 [Bacillus subtilis]|uniref:Resolvase/invertase-type recombinase catalytic domain-containing protein n=1 Tax=Bacillus subtilis TaxID=1423 RepID=A0AAX3RJZ5_BACIU|nr:hypothetical protein P5633_11720 [Bacillus subtilis]WGD61867.1 hypothetical protein P5648_13150 [Bacillus subtilis]WGD72255.1 hypothetical protein P5645_09285 [Bacillus subtilis]WGD74965.1 hypothetical protein P5631_13485 [Bacillus subtilis]WGD77740.1 hypothetical protein P5643_14075 [Bacillus subtilis]
MGSIIKAELVASDNHIALNQRLQSVIDEYNEQGLRVVIEDSYAESSRRGGNSSAYSDLISHVLVVGYDE